MKQLSLLFTFLLLSTVGFAQVGITDDSGTDDFDATPVDANAVLELRSNNKGLLLPRLTTTVIDALTDVTPGTMVYDITVNCFKGYNGTRWWPIGDDCETGPNTPPVASNVTISGDVNVGQTVAASYDFSDVDGDTESGTTYVWQEDFFGTGTAIVGANSATYTIPSTQEGFLIRVCVTPNDGQDVGAQLCSDWQTVGSFIPPSSRLNEIDYNNPGTDDNEFIEVRVEIGTDVSNMQVINYNGTTGLMYNSMDVINGTKTSDANYDYYVLSYASNGIQNGDPDGTALYDGTDLIEFASYGGTIEALDGPAQGVTSVDIGVVDSGTENVSPQRSDDGTTWFLSPPTEGMANVEYVPTPTVQFSETTATIAENGGTYTVTLNLINAGTEAVDVVLSSTHGNGASTADYSTTFSTPVTIAAGATSATFTITGVDDADIDTDETVTFAITSVSSATENPVIGANDAIVITITDDDALAGCTTPVNIVEFGFNGNSGAEPTVTADYQYGNITNAVIYRGDGLTVAGNNDRFNARNGDESSLADAVAANDYFQVTIDIGNGYTADISAIDFNWDRSNAGATELVIRSSADNYTSDLATFTGLGISEDNLAIFATPLSGLSETVTFRFYVWGASSSSGSFGFEGDARDVTIIGCVNASTPPTGATVSFDTTSISFSEGTGIAEVPINYTNNTGNDVTVNISASAYPLDLNLEGTTFIIPASSTAGTYDFTIDWTDNSTNDGDVNFTLSLANGTDYTVGTNASNTVTITEDDGTSANIEVLNISETNIQAEWSNNFVDTGYVANSEGGVRLGSGSDGGTMTYNDPISFTGSTGTVIVTIDVKGWDSNEKEGIITVGSDSFTFNVSVDKDDPDAETVTHTFTGVPTGSNVTFETTNTNGNDRFIIYSILIEKQN